MLIYSGYGVDAADDGMVAWDALQLNSSDLLVTNHDMPKLPGFDFLKNVRAANMTLLIIMATEYFHRVNRTDTRGCKLMPRCSSPIFSKSCFER